MFKLTMMAPTKRECMLVFILLLAFLLFSGTRHGFQGSHSVLLKVIHKYNSKYYFSSQTPSLDLERWRTRMTWTSNQVLPSTRMISHAAGCTAFDNLYLLNGTLYVVTDDPESIPNPLMIVSTGIPLGSGKENIDARKPTDAEFRVITNDEAQKLFGTSVDVIDGVTWILNDPPQFLQHYFHWAAEAFLAFWKTYSSLDLSISSDGASLLPALRRVWFPHTDSYHWRDYASMNQILLRGSFPSATAEFAPDWLDRMATGRPMFFDRVILTDRSAMHNGPNSGRTFRSTSEPISLPGSEHWWSVIRTAITSLSGYDAGLEQGSRPVISYISRQAWRGRRLIPEDHDNLVEALYKLRDEYDIEVNVVNMHEFTQAEQIKLAARTTIMMGVHGNGLTSLLWMTPSPEKTVMEFFIPGGFTRDYQYTAYGVGLQYYAIWNDQAFKDPDLPRLAFPEGFHGNNIPVNGEAIAKLCLERLGITPH